MLHEPIDIALDLFDDKEHQHRPFIITATIFILTFAGLSVDTLLSKEGEKFLDSPEALLWVFLSCIKTVFVVLSYFPVRQILIDLKQSKNGTRNDLQSLVIGMTIIIPLFLPLRGIVVFPLLAIKFGLLTFITAFVSWKAMSGMWLLHAHFDRLSKRVMSRHDNELDQIHLEYFLRLRHNLQELLFINGAIIGLSTLVAGAMRNAVLSLTTTVSIPKEYVLIYGIYFTFILAFAYTPTYLKSIEVGRRILDHHLPFKTCPMPHKSEEWNRWYNKRKEFREVLELDEGYGMHMQKFFSVFSPVLGSFVGILMGFK